MAQLTAATNSCGRHIADAALASCDAVPTLFESRSVEDTPALSSIRTQMARALMLLTISLVSFRREVTATTLKQYPEVLLYRSRRPDGGLKRNR